MAGLANRIESIRRVMNVGNSTIDEYEGLMDFYKERALDGCHEMLVPIINRTFNFGYRKERIDLKSPQRNYALCTLSSITSKLTRGSRNYDEETVKEIEELILYYCNYYFTLLLKNKFYYSEMEGPVLAIATLDKNITSGQYSNYESVKNLFDLSEYLFENEIHKFELKGEYGEKTEEYINRIAKAPAEGPTAIDVFGIPVARNDIVLKTLIDEIENEERKFSIMMGEKTRNM